MGARDCYTGWQQPIVFRAEGMSMSETERIRLTHLTEKGG